MTRGKIVGWFLFFFAFGFFSLQMVYLIIRDRFQVEYIDNRLFYIINILCIVCMTLSILLLLKLTNKFKKLYTVAMCVIVIAQMLLLISSNQEIKNITSISPDWKHILSIKENVKSGETVYLRSYYGILARPKERLPNLDTVSKVEWLANDIAAVTYKAEDETLQQFIATYGDRGGGTSYYYVGAEIHGKWNGPRVEVTSLPEGISVTEQGQTELFKWEHIVQFGTLAVVLKRNNEAIWTISLNEDFNVQSDVSLSTKGTIRLYKATLEKNQPITMTYVGL